MTLVLMGDSHLARVRRGLMSLGPGVRNVAVGGATIKDLDGQLDLVAAMGPETVVLSVGTNDAALRSGVSCECFVAGLEQVLVRLRGLAVINLAPLIGRDVSMPELPDGPGITCHGSAALLAWRDATWWLWLSASANERWWMLEDDLADGWS